MTQATVINMSWLNRKSAAAILGVALIAGTATYFVQEQKLARAETLQRELAEQQTQLTAARDAALAAAQSRNQEADKVRADIADLARLRNEVTQLRQEAAAAKQRQPAAVTPPPAVNAATPAVGQFIPKEQLAFAGYATPEAAVQTMVWAMVSGNYEAFTNLYPSGTLVARDRSLAAAKATGQSVDTVDERAVFESQAPAVLRNFKGLQIQARKTIRAGQGVELKVFVDGLPMPGGAPGSQVSVLTFVKEGDEWKWAHGTLHTANWEENGTIEKFVP